MDSADIQATFEIFFGLFFDLVGKNVFLKRCFVNLNRFLPAILAFEFATRSEGRTNLGVDYRKRLLRPSLCTGRTREGEYSENRFCDFALPIHKYRFHVAGRQIFFRDAPSVKPSGQNMDCVDARSCTRSTSVRGGEATASRTIGRRNIRHDKCSVKKGPGKFERQTRHSRYARTP